LEGFRPNNPAGYNMSPRLESGGVTDARKPMFCPAKLSSTVAQKQTEIRINSRVVVVDPR
jgi:hypothetical protein